MRTCLFVLFFMKTINNLHLYIDVMFFAVFQTMGGKRPQPQHSLKNHEKTKKQTTINVFHGFSLNEQLKKHVQMEVLHCFSFNKPKIYVKM